MDTFFQELRQAREARHLSLSDIADATLINVKYLEQIEQGNTEILPQTYVRAFIREYAATVGLNPDEVMKKYDLLRAVPEPAPQQPAVRKPAPAPDRSTPSPALLRWVFGGLAIIGAVIILWASLTKEQAPPVQETPFQKVITENEKRLAPEPVAQKIPEQSAVPSAPADSLTLHAAITDTVWVQMAVDDNPPHEYLFRPKSRMSWKARDHFAVTLGNGGAIAFTLNQKAIGTLGKPGSIVRNVRISRETLKQP